MAQWQFYNQNLDIFNTNNGNNGYVGIGTGTLRSPLMTKLQLFMPVNPDPLYNRLSILLEAEMNQNCSSIAEFSIAKMPHLSIYSSFATEGDAVISTRDECSEDLILTTRRYTGRIRLGTTDPENTSVDIERMTIVPTGQVGIWNNHPKNLLSIRNTSGLDFWDNNVHFQDIRFNCYAGEESQVDNYGENKYLDTLVGDSYEQSEHKNIIPGYSGIIQNVSSQGEGKLIIATTSYHSNPDSELNFFELDPQNVFNPRGIIIKNYSDVAKNYINIGMACEPDAISRVKIKGRTSDNTMNALKIVNWSNTPLFTVRNDGIIKIGEKLFVDGTGANQMLSDEELKLSVDGAIVAKEFLVTTTSERWPDFVFDKNYKLLSISDLEKFISINKRLPDLPSAKEAEMNGINVGKLQEKLLVKIEELTLYIIQLKEENEAIKKDMELIIKNRKY